MVKKAPNRVTGWQATRSLREFQRTKMGLKGGEMRKLFLIGAAVSLAYVAISMAPDFFRYMKIRAM